MKKTYLARRNALFSSSRLPAGAYALFFALVLAASRLVAPDAFAGAIAPLLYASRAAGETADGFFASFGDRAVLARENEELREQNRALAAEILALRAGEQVLSSLVRAQGSLVAGVVARPPVSPYDTLFLAGGQAEGIREGMQAFGPGGVPVGIVSLALERFSRVTLFSAPGAAVSGWVGDLPLEIRGEGGGAFSATVSKTAGVAAGDIVYGPGPGKLPLGSVARVDSDPALSGVTLRIQGAVNLFSLSWVELRDTGGAVSDVLRFAPTTP